MSCNLGFAQTYTVTRYADDSGLPSRIVRDVIQDSKGFIWVAGNNGLYRFDGQHFKPFLSSLTDSVGLRDNKINALLESANGKLWIGTPKGLHVLEQDKINHFPLKESPIENEEYIVSLFEDNNQNIWVSTNGGIFLIQGSQHPIHFLEDDNDIAISKGTVWSVNQDRKGNIWAATNDGLYVRNNDDPFTFDKVVLLLEDSLKSEDIAYFNIQQYSDSMYLLDTSHGLLKGKLQGNFFILSYFENSSGDQEKGYAVEGSIIDKEGKIWLATWKHYFKKFKIEGEQLIEEDVNAKNGFFGISGISHAVFEDQQGNIWFANTNGLYKFSLDESEMTVFPPYECLPDFLGIYAIVEDSGEHLWITTPKKLYRFKKEDLLQNKCPTDYLEIAEEYMEQARNVSIDSENRLWVGADGGLFVSQLDGDFNPGSFRRYTTQDGLPHNRTYEIHQETKNGFWIGNYHGLMKLELEEDSFDIGSLQVYTTDAKNSSSLVNTQAMEMESDGDNNLWVGTFSGVSRILSEVDGGIFENYTSSYGDTKALSNNAVKKIFRDSQNRLWIATQRGLNLYDADKNSFTQYGHKEGLPSEYVLGIAEDSRGHYWICTTNGVVMAKFDDDTKEFIRPKYYTSNDGLADNIPYRNAIHIDDSDNVFVGSRDGISIFRNTILSSVEKLERALVITKMESINKKELGFKSVADQLLENALTLSHRSNSLKSHYVILDFVNPENNTYRHKFLPQNDSWMETGKSSELIYYNLPPGEYELVLDAANSMGQWTNDPTRLLITIQPPFWKSYWAFLGYFIALAGITWFFYRTRIRKKEKEWQQKMAIETAVVNEREQLRKENAADFHDELGSMLTKISMFLTMAERNLEQDKDPKPFFKKIRDNAKGLSTGFRDLLWVIDPQKDSLADTFLRLKEFGEDLFEQSTIDFKTSAFQEVFTQCLLNPKTKKQLVMIFKEAMTNCLKYSNGTEANLILTTNSGHLKMEFNDNGSGFDVDKKSKGRGVKNMKARAVNINALLSITSSLEGTKVVLDRIPHLGDTFSLQD